MFNKKLSSFTFIMGRKEGVKAWKFDILAIFF